MKIMALQRMLKALKLVSTRTKDLQYNLFLKSFRDVYDNLTFFVQDHTEVNCQDGGPPDRLCQNIHMDVLLAHHQVRRVPVLYFTWP